MTVQEIILFAFVINFHNFFLVLIYIYYIHDIAYMFFLQGYGTNFYSDSEYYEGEFYADKRSGWGRMYYTDGSIYEGEWFDDKRSGQGMLRLGRYTYM